MERSQVFFTFCSAKKNDYLAQSGEEVTPDVLYTSQRVQSFIARCKAKRVRWAIFSDEYGVWFPEMKHKWYERSPDDALPVFPRLLADFDQKMKDFDVIHFCPGAGGPRIHRLYRKLVQQLSGQPYPDGKVDSKRRNLIGSVLRSARFAVV
jgi:hypothetical protein